TPKSKFVKKKIKETSWKDREYIKDLIMIEQYVLVGNLGLTTGYIVGRLKSKYPKEWKIIHQELNPKEYKKTLKEEREERLKEKGEEEKFEKEEAKEERRDLKMWKKLGGKV
ncbi:MAG: hypothetical protein KAU95_04325, partial [Candidatus Aenigmarchaeota archaeon]|nr:hypothetical protein [Candidatus Aenigmarchaeota archaeon]